MYYGDNREEQPRKAIHDDPPAWGGSDPDRRLEPYLKLLEGWMSTTRTLTRQRGTVIMQHATGYLRLIIKEPYIATLTDEQGEEAVVAHSNEGFQEYFENKLRTAMERAIFAPDSDEESNNR